MERFSKPQAVTKLDLAFGGDIAKLLPPYKEIPDEFKRSSNQWANWAAQWFFSGLKKYPAPKDGIDVNQAMAHLAAIQRSFEPSHEHKESGVAYLASLWFSSPDGEAVASKKPTAA